VCRISRKKSRTLEKNVSCRRTDSVWAGASAGSGAKRHRRWTTTQEAASSAADTRSSWSVPTTWAPTAATEEPVIPPKTPPEPMNPKSRLASRAR
jgi:hypothetical protein